MGSSWLVKTVPFPIRIICCSHSKHKNKFRVRGCLEQYPHILLWDQFCGETTTSIMHPGSELKQNSRQKCVCQSLNPSEMLGWTYSRSGFEFCLDTPWIVGFGLLTGTQRARFHKVLLCFSTNALQMEETWAWPNPKADKHTHTYGYTITNADEHAYQPTIKCQIFSFHRHSTQRKCISYTIQPSSCV